mgnify:CR=1 FL=1
MKQRSSTLDRRSFLKSTSAAVAAVSAPYLIPRNVLASEDSPGANETITIGYIGCGRQQGAQLCASCHEETYKQWSQRSRHSQATKSASFRKAVEDLQGNVLLAGLVKESMCYSCHGSKTRDQGVNCETCHGRPLAGVPIETTHERK